MTFAKYIACACACVVCLPIPRISECICKPTEWLVSHCMEELTKEGGGDVCVRNLS